MYTNLSLSLYFSLSPLFALSGNLRHGHDAASLALARRAWCWHLVGICGLLEREVLSAFGGRGGIYEDDKKIWGDPHYGLWGIILRKPFVTKH